MSGSCNTDTGADIEGCGAADPDNYVDCDNVDVNDIHYNVDIKTKDAGLCCPDNLRK